jgi:hypothetical protein
MKAQIYEIIPFYEKFSLEEDTKGMNIMECTS